MTFEQLIAGFQQLISKYTPEWSEEDLKTWEAFSTHLKKTGWELFNLFYQVWYDTFLLFGDFVRICICWPELIIETLYIDIEQGFIRKKAWATLYSFYSGYETFAVFLQETIQAYLPLFLIFLPFFVGLCVLFFGRYMGTWGTGLLTVGAGHLTFIVAFICFCGSLRLGQLDLSYTFVSYAEVNSYYWHALDYSCSLLFDFISVHMALLVSLVSTVVITYSVNYLKNDPHRSRFLMFLSFFFFFMLLLISSDGFLIFFFAWEGVGLCSFLLICFWTQRFQAVRAGLKAMLINKLGDVALLVAFGLTYNIFNLVQLSELNALTPSDVTYSLFGYNTEIMSTLFLCFVIACCSKSAQLGLHTWLPDAMEGPTPVSALLHAATMVTAGVVLLLRLSGFFVHAPVWVLFFVFLIGALSALFAGFCAIFQTDIKKVIAYSTCSQIGYMFFSCGLSLYAVGFTHLLSHGFFKALLFLTAGALIHSALDEQSITKLYLFENIKFTSIVSMSLYIGTTALSALPFFSGFYTKEPILLQTYGATTSHVWISTAVAFNFGLLAAVLTIYYSATMVDEILVRNARRQRSNQYHGALPWSTRYALGMLLIFSIGFGWFAFDWIAPVLEGCFASQQALTSVIKLPTNTIQYNIIAPRGALLQLPLWVELAPALVTLCAWSAPAALAEAILWKRSWFYDKFYINNILTISPQLLRLIHKLWSLLQQVSINKFWFDFSINSCMRALLRISYFFVFKLIDKGFLEYSIIHFITNTTRLVSFFITGLQQQLAFNVAVNLFLFNVICCILVVYF